MQRTTAIVLVTVSLLVASTGGALALGPPNGDLGTQSAEQEQSCDYESLFDQTIGSVVSVQTNAGQGSGFVYDAGNATDSTQIVTNAHVVGNAETVQIQFEEGEYRTGSVVGQSAFADLAVVNVTDAPDYADSLSLASTEPSRGEKVAALGNPLGLDETITHGIVSGVNRSLPTRLGFAIPDVVQTDAPISPGNSGGPLVTCDAEVVGVNTAGIAQQGAENIGFAVSASIIDRVVPELIAEGEFDYPLLGVQTTPITPTVAEANDLNQTRGIMVVATAQGGPASGVLQGTNDTEVVDGRTVPVGGDVILAVDGRQIDSGETLGTYLVTETEPGETVEFTIRRDGETQQVSVTIGERPEPTER